MLQRNIIYDDFPPKNPKCFEKNEVAKKYFNFCLEQWKIFPDHPYFRFLILFQEDKQKMENYGIAFVLWSMKKCSRKGKVAGSDLVEET